MQRFKAWLTLPKLCYILIATLMIYSQIAYYGIMGKPWVWLVEAPPDAGYFWAFSYDIFWYMELPVGWCILYISLVAAMFKIWRIGAILNKDLRSLKEEIVFDEDVAHYSMESFVDSCINGEFGDDDGYACYADKTHMFVTERILPSHIVDDLHDKTMTHVIWFNR